MAINVGQGIGGQGGASAANQSLQVGSQQVAQAGAQSAGAVDNLTAVLAGINQKIATLFAKQQKESAAREDQIMRAVSQSVERIGNQIGGAWERRAMMKAQLKDDKEMADHTNKLSRDREMERLQIQKDEEAARLAEESAIKEDEIAIANNYRAVTRSRDDYLAGLSELDGVINSDLFDEDPEARGLFRAVLSDLRSDINSHLIAQPEALADLTAAHTAKMREAYARGRAENASPSDLPAPPTLEGQPLNLSPETREKLRQFVETKGITGRGAALPDPDSYTSPGGLRDLMLAIRDDVSERKYAQGVARRDTTKTFNKGLVDAQKALKQISSMQDGFAQQLEGLAEPQLKQAVAALQEFPEEKMIDVLDREGNSVGKTIPAREIYYTLSDKLLEPIDTNHKANLRQMFRDYTEGKLVLDTPGMMQVGLLFNQVSRQIETRLDKVVEEIGPKSTLRFNRGLSSFFTGAASTQDAMVAAKRELQTVKALAAKTDSLFMNQPAVKAFYEELSSVSSMMSRHVQKLTGEKAGPLDYSFTLASEDSIRDADPAAVTKSERATARFLSMVAETDPELEAAMRNALLKGEIHPTAQPIESLGRTVREKREGASKAQPSMSVNDNLPQQPSQPLQPQPTQPMPQQPQQQQPVSPQQSQQFLNRGMMDLQRQPQPMQQPSPLNQQVFPQGGY